MSVDSTLPLPLPHTPLLPNGVLAKGMAVTVPHTPLLPPLAEGMIVIIQLPQLPQQQQRLTQLRLPLQLKSAQPMMIVQYQAKSVRKEDVCPQYAQPMLTVQYLDKPVGTE